MASDPIRLSSSRAMSLTVESFIRTECSLSERSTMQLAPIAENGPMNESTMRAPAARILCAVEDGGVVPATVAIEAANRLGASDAHLVAYATSGDVSGDRSAVVDDAIAREVQ